MFFEHFLGGLSKEVKFIIKTRENQDHELQGPHIVNMKKKTHQCSWANEDWASGWSFISCHQSWDFWAIIKSMGKNLPAPEIWVLHILLDYSWDFFRAQWTKTILWSSDRALILVLQKYFFLQSRLYYFLAFQTLSSNLSLKWVMTFGSSFSMLKTIKNSSHFLARPGF